MAFIDGDDGPVIDAKLIPTLYFWFFADYCGFPREVVSTGYET